MVESQVIALKNFAKENKFLSHNSNTALENKLKKSYLSSPKDNKVLIELLKKAQSMGFTL